MSKARGLGRGFDSLIPTEVSADMTIDRPAQAEGIRQVDPNKISPNPHQPRTDFDATELQSLADSLKQHGVLHPPVVTDLGDGRYELIAGERRVRAAKLAGLATIPVIVRSYDEQQKLELALLENVQRSQLNPIETATAYRKLADEFNLTLDQIGARMGKAKSTVANTMRLLQLPKEAREAVASGAIAEAHARAILAANGKERQQELLHSIISQSWSVRQAEEYARDTKQGGHPKLDSAGASNSNAFSVNQENASQLAAELSTVLNAKVRVQSSGKGGKLTINYASPEDLERIAALLRQR
jgi:ParB family chromosome partitioning protein